MSYYKDYLMWTLAKGKHFQQPYHTVDYSSNCQCMYLLLFLPAANHLAGNVVMLTSYHNETLT